MGSHDPFGHLKHKLWPKERSRGKLAIWFSTTKSQESPRLFYIQVMCHTPLKSFQRGLQLFFISIGSMLTKLWALEITENPTLGISELPFGSPGTKWHLGVSPMARHRVYYKREGGGFPQVRVVMSLVNLSLLVAHPNTKSALAMH
jgi:hypothetical protein